MIQKIRRCTKKPLYSVLTAMAAKLTAKFKSIEISPRPELADKISIKIEETEARDASFRFWAYGGMALISLIAIIPVIIELFKQFSQSGFYQYISLLFYDSTILTTSGNELFRAIIESIPIATIILALLIIMMFAWSFRNAFRLRFQNSNPLLAFN